MPTIVSIEGFHYQGATETTPSWSSRRSRGSDKCYLVALVDHGATGWAVHAHWGRRGSTGSGTKWGPWQTPSTARWQFENKQDAKIGEGYRRVNWTDPAYGMELWSARFGTLPPAPRNTQARPALDVPASTTITVTAAEIVPEPVADPEPLIADHVFGFGYVDRLTDVAFCALCGQPRAQHAVQDPLPPPPRLVLPDRVSRDVRPRIQIRRDLA